jgi:hypothetical protein
MRKAITTTAVAVIATAALVPVTLFGATAVGASAVKHQQAQPGGAITIQSWIRAYPSLNVLSATNTECMKITGAITDQGGGPNWADDDEFTAPNDMTGSAAINAASKECSDPSPVGGIVLVPPPAAGQYALAQYKLTTFYVNFTLAGQKGDIFITYAGTYNFSGGPLPVGSVTVPEGQTADCSWVITGGNGSYSGLQGDGTCMAKTATTYPYVWHVSTGQVWWSDASVGTGAS